MLPDVQLLLWELPKDTTENGRFLIKRAASLQHNLAQNCPHLWGQHGKMCADTKDTKASTCRKAAAAYIQHLLCSGKLAEHPLSKCLSLGAPDTAPCSKAAQGTRLPMCSANPAGNRHLPSLTLVF